MGILSRIDGVPLMSKTAPPTWARVPVPEVWSRRNLYLQMRRMQSEGGSGLCTVGVGFQGSPNGAHESPGREHHKVVVIVGGRIVTKKLKVTRHIRASHARYDVPTHHTRQHGTRARRDPSSAARGRTPAAIRRQPSRGSPTLSNSRVTAVIPVNFP